MQAHVLPAEFVTFVKMLRSPTCLCCGVQPLNAWEIAALPRCIAALPPKLAKIGGIPPACIFFPPHFLVLSLIVALTWLCTQLLFLCVCNIRKKSIVLFLQAQGQFKGPGDCFLHCWCWIKRQRRSFILLCRSEQPICPVHKALWQKLRETALWISRRLSEKVENVTSWYASQSLRAVYIKKAHPRISTSEGRITVLHICYEWARGSRPCLAHLAATSRGVSRVRRL